MFNTHSVLALVVSLSPVGGTPVVLAGSNNDRDNPHGNQMDGGKADEDNKGNQGGPGNKGGSADQEGNSGDSWDSGPRIDIGGVRVILGDDRGYQNPEPALPPGIQKDLVHGKPLPPGIAKKLDDHLLDRLPHYDGYEWMQAGTGLLLVVVATELIYKVLGDALD